MSAFPAPHVMDRPAARRRLLVALALALLAPVAAQAQGTPRQGSDPWRAPRVAKWTLLALSAGLGLWAFAESREANDAYADLRRLCAADGPACSLTSGAYANARAETLYRASNASDRRARIGLFAGQAALFGSAAFFIVDLRHGGPPDNIPYDPPAAPAGASLRLGVRMAFP